MLLPETAQRVRLNVVMCKKKKEITDSDRLTNMRKLLLTNTILSMSLLQNSDLHLASHGFPPGSAGVPPAFL